MKKEKQLFLFIILFCITSLTYAIDLAPIEITISKIEAEEIGKKIRFNETGGQDDFLMFWNAG